MPVYTRDEGNAAAAYIQAMHAATNQSWMRLLLMPSSAHPDARRRARAEYARQVRQFNERWNRR